MKTHTILASCLILAACDSADKVPEPSEAEPMGEVLPPETPVESPDTAETAKAIPAKFQGRWGLVAADCDTGRSDAKGLVEIGPDSMKFYESMAKVDQITSVSADRMTAEFDFEGEGQEWERTVMLRLENNGKTLIRTEAELDLPAEYTRC